MITITKCMSEEQGFALQRFVFLRWWKAEKTTKQETCPLIPPLLSSPFFLPLPFLFLFWFFFFGLSNAG